MRQAHIKRVHKYNVYNAYITNTKSDLINTSLCQRASRESEMIGKNRKGRNTTKTHSRQKILKII